MGAALLEFLPEIMSAAKGIMGNRSGMQQNQMGAAASGGSGGMFGSMFGGGAGGGAGGGSPGGSGAGGGMGGIGGLFSALSSQPGGPQSNRAAEGDLLNYFLTSRTNATAPFSAGEQYIKKIPTYVHQYLNPEFQAYTQQYQHPTQLMSQIGSHYQADPGYQTELNTAEQAANQAAAAGGMSGTLSSQDHAASIGQEMASRGYESYLHDALGVHGQGLSGAGAMGGQMTSDLSQYAEIMARLQEQSAAAEQAKKGKEMGYLGAAGSHFLP